MGDDSPVNKYGDEMQCWKPSSNTTIEFMNAIQTNKVVIASATPISTATNDIATIIKLLQPKK
jgi:hypothetical protein